MIPFLLLGVWWVATSAWWLFALWPMIDRAPAWIAQTRAVCFGTLPNGLPDLAGWGMLIVAPALMLATLYIGWRRELRRAWSQLRAARVGRGVIYCVAIMSAVESSFALMRIQQGFASEIFFDPTQVVTKDAASLATIPETHTPATDFSLVNQRGDTVQLAHLRGTPVILTFLFAHCQTMCPLLLQNLRAAETDLAQIPHRTLLITLDPRRDTPRSLETMATAWNIAPTMDLLSGSVDAVERVQSVYHMTIARDPRTGDITHPVLVYLIDAAGTLRFTLNNPSAAQITAALQKISVGLLEKL